MARQGKTIGPQMIMEAELSRVKIEQIASVIKVLVIVAGCCLGIWLVSQSLAVVAVELAGKETQASIVVQLLSSTTVSVGLGWTVGAGGIAYGVAQNKLRKSTVSRLHTRLKDLELQFDGKRSSSNLTKDGQTNPEDH